MPDYVRHIRDERTSNINKHEGKEPPDVAYCGRGLSQFDRAFTDVTHAVSNAQAGGYLVPCAKCKAKVIEILNSQI